MQHINRRVVDVNFVNLILSMCEESSCGEVALWLNEHGYRNAWGNPYTYANVYYLKSRWQRSINLRAFWEAA